VSDAITLTTISSAVIGESFGGERDRASVSAGAPG
jgi:hypothetical protein